MCPRFNIPICFGAFILAYICLNISFNQTKVMNAFQAVMSFTTLIDKPWPKLDVTTDVLLCGECSLDPPVASVSNDSGCALMLQEAWQGLA